jgi:hypothetical protein
VVIPCYHILKNQALMFMVIDDSLFNYDRSCCLHVMPNDFNSGYGNQQSVSKIPFTGHSNMSFHSLCSIRNLFTKHNIPVVSHL